jgi:hypothetical protein
MSSSWKLYLLLVVASTVGFACVDSGCPQGSHEVDGKCRDLADGDGGKSMRGVEGTGRGSAGSSGSGPSGSSISGRGAAGTNQPTGGQPADAGASTMGDAASAAPDAAIPEPVQCADMTCSPYAVCSEDTGTPTCVCAAGYEGDGVTCRNVDECATSTHDCGANASCLDELGSFKCECKLGYEGDGRICTANPCEPRANPCDSATTACRAEGGKAVCDCIAGRDRCDGNPLACATDSANDTRHCGACTRACAGALACEDGECEQAIVALSLGHEHSCALDSQSNVLCWGTNGSFELGRMTGMPFYQAAASTVGPVKQVDAGFARSCARTAGDDVVCWGSNYARFLSQDDTRPWGVFTIASNIPAMKEVSIGSSAICGRFESTVDCWGISLGASLGTASIPANEGRTFADRYSMDIANAVSLSMGNRMGCATIRGGGVTCWGGGRSGPQPIADIGLTPVAGATQIAVSLTTLPQDTSDSACVTLSSRRAMCWGRNDSGQLGNASNTATDVATALTVTDANSNPLEQVQQVGVGAQHACALLDSGDVVCWGRADRLGNGSSGTGAQRSFVTVRGVNDALELAVGSNHSCVRRASGQVQCWGDNAKGQLGVDPATTAASLVPVNVTGLP